MGPTTIMVSMFMSVDELVELMSANTTPMVSGNNVIQLRPNTAVYGPNPVITSLQDERRRALGFQTLEEVPKKQKKKKVMTYDKALKKVINLRVENEHMEKKLTKLDAAEKSNVKRIAKLTSKIQDNRQKIDNLCHQFNIKPSQLHTEGPIRRIGRTIVEGVKSGWNAFTGWVKENAAPITAVGLTVLAIVAVFL